MATMDKGGSLFSRKLSKVGGSLAFLVLLWQAIKEILDWGGRYQVVKESLPDVLKFLSKPEVSVLVFVVGCLLILWAWYDTKHPRVGTTTKRDTEGAGFKRIGPNLRDSDAGLQILHMDSNGIWSRCDVLSLPWTAAVYQATTISISNDPLENADVPPTGNIGAHIIFYANLKEIRRSAPAVWMDEPSDVVNIKPGESRILIVSVKSTSHGLLGPVVKKLTEVYPRLGEVYVISKDSKLSAGTKFELAPLKETGWLEIRIYDVVSGRVLKTCSYNWKKDRTCGLFLTRL